ncbi:MAG: metallophosphoesterase family protein [Muribaculaceae bacterium]|nr:metallophosphoesterase family protein [Muribaculaceae bacterium]
MKSSRRKLKTLAALLLLLAVTVWVASRWQVWFGNPEELAVKPLSAPGHVLLTFGNEDELSRNVSWQCDTVLSPSWLELVCDGDTTRIQADGEVFESRNGKAAYYVARLRQLKPASHYSYRVFSGNEFSPWYAFQTYAPGRNRFSFLYVGDVQDIIGGIANSLLMNAWAHHPEVEFLVCGGDLTERPANQYWAETFRTLDSIGQSIPVLNVTGNHDYFKGVVRRLERRFPLVFSYFLDSKQEENMVYTLNYGDAQLFVLDSNREFFHLWTQRQWLKEQLEKSKAKWKILVLHHPLYSIKKKNNNLIQRWMFDDLVRQYSVDLVLQGHEHAYARMIGGLSKNNRPAVPVYTVSHCSPKNYRIRFDERFDKFGISSRYYQVVNVSGDTLAMATYDANTHALYDSLRVVIGPYAWHIVQDLGKDIPEYMEFTPDPNNKKDQKFAKRIQEYVNRHPERQKKLTTEN